MACRRWSLRQTTSSQLQNFPQDLDESLTRALPLFTALLLAISFDSYCFLSVTLYQLIQTGPAHSNSMISP